MVPDVLLDRRISRGMWDSPMLTKYFPPVQRLSNPLGGGSAESKNLYIYYCVLPRSMCTSQLPLVEG